jgi:hypothetical protein
MNDDEPCGLEDEIHEPTYSVIFIGGVAHGKSLPDPKSKYWNVPRTEQIPVRDTVAGNFLGDPLNVDVYRRERVRLRGLYRNIIIYVLDSLTIEQAIAKMVN